ncbi:MAG: hypothetical protein IPJ19_15325 [Planctomycetes bacterium]|nr:hypothetical protein [Planctomycetota bacterium]
MLSRITFILTVVLSLCFGTASNSVAQTSSMVTVEICCSSQQKVDQDHGVTLEVEGPNGVTVGFSVFVPKGTTSAQVASKLAEALRGNGIPVGNPTPNTHPRYAENTAWDVKLPAGYSLHRAKVQKCVDGHWQEDHGHMKIRDNVTKVAMYDFTAHGEWSTMPDTTDDGAPFISTLNFTQEACSGGSMAMEVYLRGIDAQGDEFSCLKTVMYEPGADSAGGNFADIGDCLASLGMTVTYPTSSQMQVDVTTSGLSLQEVEFTMYDAGDDVTNDSEVSWGFEAL